MEMTIEEYMKINLMIEIFNNDEEKLNNEIYKLFNYQDKTDIEKQKFLLEIYKKIKLNEDFVRTFEFNGIEYGFIPNLSKITTQEVMDFERLMVEGKHLNKIAAILYRPITHKFNTSYKIEEYEGYEKYGEIMNKVDSLIIIGALAYLKQLSISLPLLIGKKIENETR
jgi:hypothetical protein